jgi:5-(carboxyamino)imidazole ribonucleotide synthase
MQSNSKKCIGILGGGQLARMSAFQAIRLGFDIAILEKIKDSPAGQLTKNEFVGWVDDEELLQQFVNISDVITLENEFIDYQHLEKIESLGKKVFPSPDTIRLIQDKFTQKSTLKNHGIPVAEFVKIADDANYNEIAALLGSKFIVKSRKMGYDGYGNFIVQDEKSFQQGIKVLSSRHNSLMAEKLISFQKELAVMVVRNHNEYKLYPVVETIQENHICKIVIAPAGITDAQRKMVQDAAYAAVEAVNGIGIFGVELFLEEDNVLINEMAPRPHNSGHYTIEGSVTSQFENHIRSVLNLPLGSTELIKNYAVMINLLGKRGGTGNPGNYKDILKYENVHLHMYGKAESRIGRKMGHLTLLGDELDQILNRGLEIETIVDI